MKFPQLALLFAATGLAACGGAPVAASHPAAAQKPPTTPTPASSAAPAAPAAPPVAPTVPPAAPPASTGLFPQAAWLHQAPVGAALDISALGSHLKFELNTHDQGFDYPVAYTDGSRGCTNFTDTLQYSYTDHLCVPNPAEGYHPSVGAWGADDGHLIVIDTANHEYFDFWKLYVNAQGEPTSHNVGKIVSGSLDGNGTPGTTAANITGLAGDILPGELDCPTCLNHALNVIVPGSMNSKDLGDQAPVKTSDGNVPGGIFREGAKIRFDPSVDVSQLDASTAAKAVMRALQLYGGVITDQTGSPNHVGFYTALAAAPDTTGMEMIGQHLLIYY